mgnify:CR=1 FL=1
MVTGLVYDDRFLEHDTGSQHPERAERLVAIVNKLKATHLWGQLRPIEFGPASLEQLLLVHDRDYIQRVEDACSQGQRYIDVPDSKICSVSYETARLATGGVIAGARHVVTGQVNNAFCAVRPPGHHAERNRSMGFCLFNHVAIAAEILLREHGLERIAIIDFDVHHGNGTQHIFEHRQDVFYISLHEHPARQYPGTGFSWERGQDAGLDHTLNITFDPGQGDAECRMRVNQMVLPALQKYRPDMIILSAGFDGSEHDPLGNLNWSAECFMWMTRQFKAAAEEYCNGRLLSVLEGGYDTRALAECVALHVGTLLEPEGYDRMMAMKSGL